MPEEVVSILIDIYQGSSFQVQTAGGQTEEIPQDWGVKQGCPLSPLVFNLAVEGLIRGIESSPAEGYSFSEDLQVKSLAYADDLAIAASSEEDIIAMLTRLEKFTSQSPVQCGKVCVTFHNLSEWQKGGSPTQFHLNGQVIPAMGWEDRYEGNGYQVYLDAFVVGSLGTWDPENDHLLPVLGIGRKYGVLFKKLCCRDALAGSYEVWAAQYRLHFQQSSSS